MFLPLSSSTHTLLKRVQKSPKDTACYARPPKSLIIVRRQIIQNIFSNRNGKGPSITFQLHNFQCRLLFQQAALYFSDHIIGSVMTTHSGYLISMKCYKSQAVITAMC